MRNWEDVLPKKLARSQHSWERRMMIARAVNAGEKLKDIANYMGLSYGRTHQMYVSAKRRIAKKEKSPIEKYFDEYPWFTEVKYIEAYQRNKIFDNSTESGQHAIKRAARRFASGELVK